MGDLSGFHYHTGLVFSVYLGAEGGDSATQSQALLRGGRFVGQGADGSERPAVGFSMDINPLLALIDNDEETVIVVDYADVQRASMDERRDLSAQIRTLQDEGCIVIMPLTADDMPSAKDGILHLDAGVWAVRLVGE